MKMATVTTFAPTFVWPVLLLMSVGTVVAMDRGQFKDVSPQIRQWFEELRSPVGTPCCSYADGHRTEYETRGDQYWVPISGQWYAVPPDAVVHAGNPIGEAVVWYAPVLRRGKWDGDWQIFCFVPSDGA
jgi:hypothetical protein